MESHQPKHGNTLAKVLNAIVLVLVIVFILMYKDSVVNAFIGWGMGGIMAQVLFFLLLLVIFAIAAWIINLITKNHGESE